MKEARRIPTYEIVFRHLGYFRIEGVLYSEVVAAGAQVCGDKRKVSCFRSRKERRFVAVVPVGAVEIRQR